MTVNSIHATGNSATSK